MTAEIVGESLNYFYGIGGGIHTDLTSFFFKQILFASLLSKCMYTQYVYTSNTAVYKKLFLPCDNLSPLRLYWHMIN